MADSQPGVSVGAQEVKMRSLLIFATLGVAALIIFGILYLFVLAPSAPGSSAAWYLFAFATGLTMIVMPCTLPLAFVIVPLSMGKGLVKGLSMALGFGLGIAVTQSLYGVAAAIIGSLAIGALGAPLEAVKNWVYLFAGSFALLFAIGEIGLIKMRMPTYTGAAPAFIQKRQDVLKAFLLGLFLGNIGIGCPHPATPLLLIEAASSGNIAYGWLLFLTHAIGRVLPLLFLAFLGILGVNGLAWLMERKESVERATGWAMVFVAGFILTLGLFTHAWWVNSGIHSGLESITQEHYFNQTFNAMLNTSVAHEHGLETGTAMFGLPLWLGNWFLVLIWLLPMWWWWTKKRRELYAHPSFKLRAIEQRIDGLEQSRRELEEVIKLDDTETDFDLKAHRATVDALEVARREAETKVQYAETGVMKEPIARPYEMRILSMQRNYLITLSITLALVFIYFLPTNFALRSTASMGAHHAPAATTASTQKTTFDRSVVGLPEATVSEVVSLKDGDSYSMTASYVKKQVGNRTLRMLAYNGSIPGPFIKAPLGAEITINFKNNTDLDQTIHSHGVRVENIFDGTPDLSQKVVRPGESFVYKIKFLDPGVAWYHPHTRDDIGQELGLYGNYIIEPSDANYWSEVNREVPLIIDDILIVDNDIAPFYKESINHALLGRFGNEFLVNGEEGYALPVKKNEVVRFFVTNVSNARTYNLSIPNAKIKLVGSDLGRYEQEQFVDSVLLAPAERTVVEVLFDEVGNYKLVHTSPKESVTLASFVVLDELPTESFTDTFDTLRTNTTEKELFATYRDKIFAEPDKKLSIGVNYGGMMDHGGHAHASADTSGEMPMAGMDGMSGMMNFASGTAGIQWDDVGNTDVSNTNENVTWLLTDEVTGKSNMEIRDWTFKTGSLVKIRITNPMVAMHVMQHPIHLHGQRFVVLSRNGVANDNMVWKDTSFVLPGETVDILVDMSNSGEWMLHCHIVEHLHAGMALVFRVQNEDGSASGDAERLKIQSEMKAATTQSSIGTYTYEANIDSKGYTATPEQTNFAIGYKSDLKVFFKDASGSAIKLSTTEANPLRIYFVRSDNASSIETYPGKTDFPVVAPVAPKVIDPESLPHSHSSLMNVPKFIAVAYAHNGVQDGHPDLVSTSTQSYTTYAVPVLFTEVGTYRAFVEFIPENETTPRQATFIVTVAKPTFSVDSLGWTLTQKWWILLTISLILIALLSIAVRRYLTNE